MKCSRIILGCVVVVIVMSLCSMKPIAAVSKKMRSLDTNLTYINTRFVPVEKGKEYKIYDFLKDLKAGIGIQAKEELRVDIKDKRIVSLSGKGLKIKKRTFQAKKQGDYFLRVETEKNNYVFPLYVVDSSYKVQPDNVAKVSIGINIMGKETKTMVTDRETICQVVEKINQAKYSFDFASTQKPRTGFGGYFVNIYLNGENAAKELRLDEGGFRMEDALVSTGIRWSGKTTSAKECYDCVRQVFNNALPEYSGYASTC